MKVDCLPAGSDASANLRVVWPGVILADQGHSVSVRHSRDCAVDVDLDIDGRVCDVDAPDCDVLVLQRIQTRGVVEAIPLLQAKGVAVVLDIDDAFSLVHPANEAYETVHPEIDPDSNWHWLDVACQRADMVTVTTPALADLYGQHGRVRVIPNRLPARVLDVGRPNPASTFRVGWPGNIDVHPTDLQAACGAIGDAIRDVGLRFVNVGPGGCAQAVGVDEEYVTGFVPGREWYAALAANIDIGVAPLAATQFNSAKCLDAPTRVATRRGIIPIGEVTEGDQVWNDGRWRTVLVTQAELPRPGLAIETRSGRRLRLTGEHRLWTTASGWTRADAIRVGDLLATTGDEIGATTYRRSPWPADSRSSRKEDVDRTAYLRAEDSPTVLITERWGRFLGLFAGDGSCGGIDRHTQVRIHCDGQDHDLIDLIMDDFRAFGLNPTTDAVRLFNGTLLRRRTVGMASAHLLRVLHSFGMTDGRRKVVAVPEIIWRSPRPVVAAFLSGLFEADGSATGTGVSLTMKGEQFIRDIQRLLAGFGIDSFVTRRMNAAVVGGEKRPYWQLRLRRSGTDLFEKEIGFLSERKCQRLARITARPHSNAYKPMWLPDEVVAIEPCMVTPVDVQVDGEVFAAAGFVSHNSGLKLLELSALGIPTVASPTPDNQRLHALGMGVLAYNPVDWYREVRRLATDRGWYREVAGRSKIAATSETLEAHVGEWWEAWTAARVYRDAAPAATVGR